MRNDTYRSRNDKVTNPVSGVALTSRITHRTDDDGDFIYVDG
jgi:hypothetical protein